MKQLRVNKRERRTSVHEKSDGTATNVTRNSERVGGVRSNGMNLWVKSQRVKSRRVLRTRGAKTPYSFFEREG